jgi:hypothetical protein
VLPLPDPDCHSTRKAARVWHEVSGQWQIILAITSNGDHIVQLGSAIILPAVAICLASCSQEVEYTDQQRACIAQRYIEFDARKLSQCVDVCKACMNGNDVTCNTSCKLKGAS